MILWSHRIYCGSLDPTDPCHVSRNTVPCSSRFHCDLIRPRLTLYPALFYAQLYPVDRPPPHTGAVPLSVHEARRIAAHMNFMAVFILLFLESPLQPTSTKSHHLSLSLGYTVCTTTLTDSTHSLSPSCTFMYFIPPFSSLHLSQQCTASTILFMVPIASSQLFPAPIAYLYYSYVILLLPNYVG